MGMLLYNLTTYRSQNTLEIIKSLAGFMLPPPPPPLLQFLMFYNRFTNRIRWIRWKERGGEESSLIEIASKFFSAFQLLTVSEAFSEMQLVSFTACLLGIATLSYSCSFTLTCRSQGREQYCILRWPPVIVVLSAASSLVTGENKEEK